MVLVRVLSTIFFLSQEATGQGDEHLCTCKSPSPLYTYVNCCCLFYQIVISTQAVAFVPFEPGRGREKGSGLFEL